MYVEGSKEFCEQSPWRGWCLKIIPRGGRKNGLNSLDQYSVMGNHRRNLATPFSFPGESVSGNSRRKPSGKRSATFSIMYRQRKPRLFLIDTQPATGPDFRGLGRGEGRINSCKAWVKALKRSTAVEICVRIVCFVKLLVRLNCFHSLSLIAFNRKV